MTSSQSLRNLNALFYSDRSEEADSSFLRIIEVVFGLEDVLQLETEDTASIAALLSSNDLDLSSRLGEKKLTAKRILPGEAISGSVFFGSDSSESGLADDSPDVFLIHDLAALIEAGLQPADLLFIHNLHGLGFGRVVGFSRDSTRASERSLAIADAMHHSMLAGGAPTAELIAALKAE